jgi:hypothetical protein
MPSSFMRRRVDLVITDVSKLFIAYIIIIKGKKIASYEHRSNDELLSNKLLLILFLAR